MVFRRAPIDLAPAELFAIMPPTVARLAVEMSGAKRRSCGRSAAFSSSSTTPGSTRTQRSTGFNSRMRLKYFDVSMTRPLPIAWPACDVPPPSSSPGSDGLDVTACTTSSRISRPPRRAARSGRRWRQWNRARARSRRSGLRLRWRPADRAEARRRFTGRLPRGWAAVNRHDLQRVETQLPHGIEEAALIARRRGRTRLGGIDEVRLEQQPLARQPGDQHAFDVLQGLT